MENREDGADERRDPIAESGGSQSGPVSLLGSHLEEAQKTDFFNFFNLREDTVVLRPGGDFRDLAAVNVHLDRQGRISDMELRLSRSFIDDRKSAVFAGDFAKSFLRSAVPPADREAVEALAMDIEYRHPRETGFEIMPLHPGAVPPLPEQPSPGYPVYVGKQPLYEQALSRSALRLENLQVEGIDVLLISLRIEGDWALDGDEERPAEMQDEYQDTGLFAPAAAQELLRQAHWTAQFDSAGQFTSSLRPRLCFLLLQALESPENEVYPLQDGAATDPGRTEPGVAGGAFPPGGRRTPTAHPTAHGRGVPGTVDGG